MNLGNLIELPFFRREAEPDSQGMKNLEGAMATTLSAFARLGEVDKELVTYSPQAMELAFALFPDEQLAFQITLDAALNVRRQAQKKEHYRRYALGEKKTKILLNRVQLFQQMVWCEAQKWERYQETDYLVQVAQADQASEVASPLPLRVLENELEANEIHYHPHLARLVPRLTAMNFQEADLVVRYLELLLQEASATHATHTALAVGHLVYDDGLSFVADVCALLSPKATGGQYLYGLRAKILRRVKERFRYFLTWTGGDTFQRFTPAPEAETKWRTTTLSWFQKFIPWKTSCPSLVRKKTGSLSFVDQLFQILEDIPDGDQKEATCVHTVLCPTCYHALRMESVMVNQSSSLPKPKPDARLSLPSFQVPKLSRGDQPPGTGPAPLPPRPAEVRKQFRPALEQEAARFSEGTGQSSQLLIFVDGKKCGELNPNQLQSTRISIDDQARLIKVMAHHPDGLILVGSLWLTQAGIFSVALADAHELLFEVSVSETMENRFNLTLTVQPPTSPSWLDRCLAELKIWHLLDTWKPAPALVVCGFALLLLASGLLLYREARTQPATQVSRWETSPNSQDSEASPQAPFALAPSEKAVWGKIKVLCVARIDTDDSAQLLASALMFQLGHQNFALTLQESQADALVKCTWKKRNEQPMVQVLLVTPENKMLFAREFPLDSNLSLTATTIARTLADERSKAISPGP
ncbi:MAG: hypothetical protein K1Y36_04165 [Blastocatellia bacterium]|nr:hypothetical protein [Blastocatellia bacterium]